MERIIKLLMEKNKDIVVSVNGKTKLCIDDKRSIKAEDIFSLLEYSVGDHYKVESENPYNKDEQVLRFFFELLQDIAQRLNNLCVEDEDVKEFEDQMESILSADQEKI